PNGELDSTFSNSSWPGSNAEVLAIAVDASDNIYLAGNFTAYRNSTANFIAKVDSDGVLDTGFNPSGGPNGANNVVRSVFVSGSDLYIGGDLTAYKGSAA